jgi:hypothetical protein
MPQQSDSTSPRTARCPRCGKAFEFRSVAEHKTFPFCSARCREADLGNWLMGRYRIPGAPLPPKPPDEEGGGD